MDSTVAVHSAGEIPWSCLHRIDYGSRVHYYCTWIMIMGHICRTNSRLHMFVIATLEVILRKVCFANFALILRSFFWSIGEREGSGCRTSSWVDSS